jgi:hypothetical protein
MAAGRWGREHASEKDAKQALNIVEGGMLEIVGRLNAFIDALIDEQVQERLDAREERRDALPDDAAVFTDAKTGDRLYSYEDDDGIQDWLVIAMDEEYHVRIVPCDYKSYQYWNPFWATSGNYHKTPAEAMRACATENLEYHERYFRFHTRFLEALDKGGDLTPFLCGIGEDSEEDARDTFAEE